MSVELELPHVLNCSVEGCSYNHGSSCNAAAVTIGSKDKAKCQTFIPLSIKGGLDRVTAFVGACSRQDCVFNRDLECGATAVRVGDSDAECLTFQAR